ncbi:NADH dehydrogenase subunit 4L [Tanacetum coccineum]
MGGDDGAILAGKEKRAVYALVATVSMALARLAVNSNFLVFSVSSDDMMGQSFASLVPTVAAAESAACRRMEMEFVVVVNWWRRSWRGGGGGRRKWWPELAGIWPDSGDGAG